MKYYKHGKDQEYLPCIELDDGTIITALEVVLALVKTLNEKGVVKQDQIKEPPTTNPNQDVIDKLTGDPWTTGTPERLALLKEALLRLLGA